jgi:predicted kinase
VLIVISGPIASGKSTLARAVARQLEGEGFRAAVIDLDLVYDMLDHRTGVPKGDEASWLLARQAAAALTDAFLMAGLDVVIVDGSFLTPTERAVYVDALRTPAEPRFVTLLVSYPEALRRAQADLTRAVSRDPAFLAPYYSEVEHVLSNVAPTDLVLDTARIGIGDAVTAIAALARSDHPEARERRRPTRNITSSR